LFDVTEKPGARASTAFALVGRSHDLAQIRARLARGERLITLLGPGGVGKTRLLEGLAEDPTRPAVPCDLASARTHAELVAAVATHVAGLAIGASSTSAQAVARVARALAKRGSLLLLLDNLEQLEGDALPLLEHWLEAAPELAIVTTSRVRLGLPGECVHLVSPLSVESDGSDTSDALALFQDRSRRVRPSFSSGEQAIASRIVAVLEGLPLAIEMAASRLRVLSPEELLARLSRPLEILANAGRPRVLRHASMVRVLDESWSLLSELDRDTLAELSVFVGGFSLRAAEAVASTENVPSVVERLSDSSLVRRAPSRSLVWRHAPYEVVREYALERLAEGPRLEQARLRHAEHFARWGSSLREKLDETTLLELVDEEPNLSEALRFSKGKGHEALRLSLLTALEPARMLRGQLDEWIGELLSGLEAFEKAEEAARRVPDASKTCRPRLALARANHELGRIVFARTTYEHAIAEADVAKNFPLVGQAKVGLGRLLAGLGAWEDACAHFDDARHLAAADPATRALAHACYEFYGTEIGASQDVVSAVFTYVETCRHGADPRELAFWLVQLGRAESELRREPEGAERHIHEALDLTRRLGDVRGEGFALFGLGAHCLGYRKYPECISSLQISSRLLREVGARRYEGWATGFLGMAHLALRELPAALCCLDEAIAILRDVEDVPRTSHLFAFRSVAHALSGNHQRALDDGLAAESLAPPQSRYHRWTLDLCKAHERLRVSLSSTEANEARTSAKALLRRAAWPGEFDLRAREWPWGGEFYEPRFAAELLHQSLEDRPKDTLVVSEDAAIVFLPNGSRVELGGHERARSLLLKLTRERMASPGTALSMDTLVHAVWPNERILPAAAKNRLQVTLHHLRSLGLRDLILRRDGGWLLCPQVPCSWASSGS